MLGILKYYEKRPENSTLFSCPITYYYNYAYSLNYLSVECD